MNTWVFDSRPTLEWRTTDRRSFERFRLSECQVIAIPRPEEQEDRYPIDPMIQYFLYRDWLNRISTVAFIDFSKAPGRTAHLVELCWTQGIPVVLVFETPPRSEVSVWKSILTSRSIEQRDLGKLSWRPVISWKCSHNGSFLDTFTDWFRTEEPLFPPPLVRIEFSNRIETEEAAAILEKLQGRSLPCRFKMFSLTARASAHYESKRWKGLLALFQKASLPSPGESKVIDLFPENAGSVNGGRTS